MQPIILAQASLTKGGQYITMVVAYYEELDQPQYNEPTGHMIPTPEPYKMIKYSGQSITDEWEYEYQGRARNRIYIEIGKAVMEGYTYVSGNQNFQQQD